MFDKIVTFLYTKYISLVVLRGRCGTGCRFHFPIHIYSPSRLFIGSNVKIGPFTSLLCQGRIDIQDDVLIAANCVITSTGHNLHPSLRDIETRHKVTISSNVWIGASSSIMPGVCIGRNSVVAAASIVTRNIPENSIFIQKREVLIEPLSHD